MPAFFGYFSFFKIARNLAFGMFPLCARSRCFFRSRVLSTIKHDDDADEEKNNDEFESNTHHEVEESNASSYVLQ